MAEMKRVIQFPHRAVEFECQKYWLDQANHITKWNPADHHWRRLIHCAGRYVDEDRNIRKGNLSFWSEWEANTVATPFPQAYVRNGKRDITAQWVHEVLKPDPRCCPYGPSDDCDECALNTDPCVFGKTFKYSNCRQKGHPSLMDLDPGSLIVFGSTPNGRFCLDTVFVVGSRKSYITGDASSIQGLGTSQDYRDLTLDRLGGGESFVFYRGATVKNSVEGMYSFVPAREWGTQGCGERCVLNFTQLPSGGMFNLANTRNFRVASCNSSDAPKVWREIRDYVLNAGYWLGVEFKWPTRKYAGGKIVQNAGRGLTR